MFKFGQIFEIPAIFDFKVTKHWKIPTREIIDAIIFFTPLSGSITQSASLLTMESRFKFLFHFEIQSKFLN